MGKTQSKQPLSQDQLYKIYRSYKVSNNAKVAKSKRFLPLDLNKESIYCFGCVPAKTNVKFIYFIYIALNLYIETEKMEKIL